MEALIGHDARFQRPEAPPAHRPRSAHAATSQAAPTGAIGV
jgi:hypothetical protein